MYAEGSGFEGVHTILQHNFNKWGFVIFRGVYDDDAAWDTFINILKDNTMRSLREDRQEEKLGAQLEWTIIEDRDALDNASKDAVRDCFRKWVDARSVERDGPGADQPKAERAPRFRCCVYVDKASFDSLAVSAFQDRLAFNAMWDALPVKPVYGSLSNPVLGDVPNYWSLQGQVVLIDGSYEYYEKESDDEDDGEDEIDPDDFGWGGIEGNTREDVGWMYVDTISLLDMYDSLCYGGSQGELWYGIYRGRRPDKGPEAGRGKPLLAAADGQQPAPGMEGLKSAC